MLTIVAAASGARIAQVAALFREYARSLDVDLAYQGFAEEVAGLPGAYGPPRGCLLLALEDEEPVGCVALRPLGEDVCEMKRLYLRPSRRGHGAGRRLAQAILDEARALGYRQMRLDTLPPMTDALALYEKLGFQRIAPYYASPVAGSVFMERTL